MTFLLRLLPLALFALAQPAFGQITVETMFDPNDSGVSGGVSGEDDCGLDPHLCNPYRTSVSAQAGRTDQHFSTLEFGYRGGKACLFSAPPPVDGAQVHNRRWNDCPGGTANQMQRLSTTSLPGPDYGLKRLRICTDGNGSMHGLEARFFKLPHRPHNAAGQDIEILTFERNACTTWEDWSACPAGTAASRVKIYKEAINGGGIAGLELTCTRVITSGLRPR